jgi:alginate O-acetyltransferase complex protein AlgI
MLFSSLLFLYLFLPIALLGYYIAGNNYRNYWLLLVSLVFFAWGGVSFTAILLLSIVLNYFAGLMVQKHLGTRSG